MAIVADIAEDLLYVDGLRPMTLKIAGRADVKLAGVLDEPPTWKEMEASRGQVVQGDTLLIWQASKSVKPPLGAVLIDGDGTVWTVLAVEFKDQVNTYEALVRNLSIINSLDNRVTILRAEYSKGRSNDALPTWSEVATDVPARVQPFTEAAQIFESAEFIHDAYRVILGYTVDIELASAEYRLVDAKGKRYRVVQYLDQERIDSLPVAIAVKILEGSESIQGSSDSSSS